MFGKKKQQSFINSADISKSISNDFRYREGDGYGLARFRTVDYREYEKLTENVMIPKLDEHLKKLFAGDVDAGNGDMLNSIIFGPAREALPDLKLQRYDHCDMIRMFIIKHSGDYEDIKRFRDLRQNERDSLQADYDKICELLELCEEV